MIEERGELLKIAVKVFLVTFALLYFILTGILITQYLTTQTATRDFWDSISFASDIIGILALLFSTVLWIFGFRSLRFDDVVRATEVGVIENEKFDVVYQSARVYLSGLPDTPNMEDTLERTKQIDHVLEKSGFIDSQEDFHTVQYLLNSGLIEQAVIPAKQGLERFLNELALHFGVRKEEGVKLRPLVKELRRLNIITVEEQNIIIKFVTFSNAVFHGNWEPNKEEGLGLISGIMSTLTTIANRHGISDGAQNPLG